VLSKDLLATIRGPTSKGRGRGGKNGKGREERKERGKGRVCQWPPK